MTSIERTAYPRFGRQVSARELAGLSPSADEVGSLRRCEVSIDCSPAEAFEAFDRKLSETAAVESSRPGEVVAQFEGHAGPFSNRTRELVRFTDSAVTFEHIEGPFRSCAERFVIGSNGSSTTVAHEGTFTMRGGLAGWLLGMIVVRPFFERLVADELVMMASPAVGESPGT
ncbi:MAG: hypothetical protein ABR540_22520 [Acidimicrobiales bacterium]|nr:hypothetical protein [Actinomycetota bacterium]